MGADAQQAQAPPAQSSAGGGGGSAGGTGDAGAGAEGKQGSGTGPGQSGGAEGAAQRSGDELAAPRRHLSAAAPGGDADAGSGAAAGAGAGAAEGAGLLRRPSCAVVGNAGRLRNEAHGVRVPNTQYPTTPYPLPTTHTLPISWADVFDFEHTLKISPRISFRAMTQAEIDRMDFVFRFNNGVTRGFERQARKLTPLAPSTVYPHCIKIVSNRPRGRSFVLPARPTRAQVGTKSSLRMLNGPYTQPMKARGVHVSSFFFPCGRRRRLSLLSAASISPNARRKQLNFLSFCARGFHFTWEE